MAAVGSCLSSFVGYSQFGGGLNYIPVLLIIVIQQQEFTHFIAI